MKWNLRLTAANKGIWKASELQRSLAEHGLVISAGKMSGLWSGQPVSLKLEDLDVICVVLGCEIGDLLIPEPGKVPRPGQQPGGRRPRPARGWPRRWCPSGATAVPSAGVTWSPSPWGRSARTSRRPPARAVSPGGQLPGRFCRGCYTYGQLHAVSECVGCRRQVPVDDKHGYCRLCRAQATWAIKASGKASVIEPYLRRVTCQQLFFANLQRPKNGGPRLAGPGAAC